MPARKETYKAVRDRIRAEMPWIKWIDLQKGQMDSPSKSYPLPLPCALVEFKPVTWENFPRQSQIGWTTISIWLYLDHSGDSVKGAQMEEQSLALMDSMDEVFQKLEDLSGPSFKRLVRINDQVVAYKPRMIVYRCDFSTDLHDYCYCTENTIQLPQAEITV